MQRCQNSCSFTGAFIEATETYTLAKAEDGIIKKSAKYTLGTAAHFTQSLMALMELVATSFLYAAAKIVQCFLPRKHSEWFKDKVVEPLSQRNLDTALGMCKAASRTMTNFISKKSRRAIEKGIHAVFMSAENPKVSPIAQALDKLSQATISSRVEERQQISQEEQIDKRVDWRKCVAIVSGVVLVAATAYLIYRGYGPYVVKEAPSEWKKSLALVVLPKPKIKQCLPFTPTPLKFCSLRPPVFSNKTLVLGQCPFSVAEGVKHNSITFSTAIMSNCLFGFFSAALGMYSSSRKKIQILPKEPSPSPKNKERSPLPVFSPLANVGFLSPNKQRVPSPSPKGTIAKRVKENRRKGGRLRRPKKPCIGCGEHKDEQNATNVLKDHPINELRA